MIDTIQFKLNFVRENYLNDVEEVIRAFYPYVELVTEHDDILSILYNHSEGIFYVELSYLADTTKDSFSVSDKDILEYKRLTKHFLKNCLYKLLVKITNINLPYGSLTGVRPTKVYYDSLGTKRTPTNILIDDYFVSPDRVKLIEETVDGQKGIYLKDEHCVDVFINIPFCPTRCKYCSFISTEYFRVEKKIPLYIEKVIFESKRALQKIAEEELQVRAIYVGGGTPTSLTAEGLDSILSNFANLATEFTVEAGRPDSLTRDKLEVLKKNNVTRISINPQTANDKTLEFIGRKHTFADILEKYKLAREYNFDINMDLICGLEGETFEDFAYTLSEILKLSPENITIHTLSIKRGAVLAKRDYTKIVNGEMLKMTNYAYKTIKENGYFPYYMYRQKNTADNLENVSFSKKGKECIYNIDIMEETTSIIGIGAGAMSKTVYIDNNRIERTYNAKDINYYIERNS